MSDNTFTNTTDAKLLYASQLRIEFLQAENERLKMLVRDAGGVLRSIETEVKKVRESGGDKMFRDWICGTCDVFASEMEQEMEGGDDSEPLPPKPSPIEIEPGQRWVYKNNVCSVGTNGCGWFLMIGMEVVRDSYNRDKNLVCRWLNEYCTFMSAEGGDA